MSIEQAPPSERNSPLHSKICFSKFICCISHWCSVQLFFSFICFFMPKCCQSVLFKIETFIRTFPRFYEYRLLVSLHCIICLGILSSGKLSKSFTDFLLYYAFVAAFGDFCIVWYSLKYFLCTASLLSEFYLWSSFRCPIGTSIHQSWHDY
jgi:hypothetical protein